MYYRTVLKIRFVHLYNDGSNLKYENNLKINKNAWMIN